uniref:uncharacterized protein myripa n=1 Tax=Monopterus albus TaxID=43700 RepID=UPI0009B32629|nr:uncharacterized protein LOC109955318 [Monopterus albus]
MAEMLTVALQVAEEAIDEAISKAEFDTASQEKQNETHYLQQHRRELIEELAKTIVHKIISKRKTLAEMRTDYDQDWPLKENPDLHHPQPTCDQASSSLKHQPGLWRSHSACSLLDNKPPGLIQDSSQVCQKEGCASALSTWKSVDLLDNAVVSSLQKSPDGNWITLQSTQLSHTGLLTRKKGLVYSTLERESGVVSAYEGLDSDESEPDSSWGAMLQEIHRKMMDSNLNLQDSRDRIQLSLMGCQGSRDHLFSDSERNWMSNKPLLAEFKRELPAEVRRTSSSCRTNIIDVNVNIEGAGEKEQSSVAPEPKVGRFKRSRKKRRGKKQQAASPCVSDIKKKDNQSQYPSDAVTPDTLTSGAITPEPCDLGSDLTRHGANRMDEELELKLQQLAGRVSDFPTRQEERDKDGDDGAGDEQMVERRQGGEDRDERPCNMEIDLGEGSTEEGEQDLEADDEEMKYRLYKLVKQSRLSYFSSTDDELVGQREGDKDEDMEEEKMEGLAHKLCQLEKEVRATQLSSTEDDLDTAERDEAIDEETRWKLEAEKAAEAAQLRDLASLFSSTEDKLERVEEQNINEGGIKSSTEMAELWGGAVERRESFTDLDVKMFDFREELEEMTNECKDKVTTQNSLGCQIMTDVHEGKPKVEAPGKMYLFKYKVRTAVVEENVCEEQLEDTAEKAKESEETQGRKLITVATVKMLEETEGIDLNETRVKQENPPEAKWPDEKEGEGKEKVKERKESLWEMAADSNEEDEEFDRRISSMLMMRLEDTQAETFKDENGRTSRELEDSGFREKVVDAQNTNSSEETGSANEFQSRGDKNVKDRPRERTEQSGEFSRKKESEDAMSRIENEQEERDTDSQERGNLAKEKSVVPTVEQNEAERTCTRTEVDVEEQQNRKGRMTPECQTMEMRGVATEGEHRDRDEKPEETDRNADELEQSSTSSLQEGFLSPQEIRNRYSAVSLCSITTEVLKVLNATEELLLGVEGGDRPQLSTTSLLPSSNPKKLDQQFSRLEENVYVAAGSVYSLEAELSDLEECARGICGATSDAELSFLEEQVASAAAMVQQSELQIGDISARIAALKNEGLNVDTQSHFTKTRTIPVMPVTLNSSRQLRRRLPAPPVKEEAET